jgi:inorganic pyrophosphatase
VVAPDGDELDAYVLGPAGPVGEFEGECIAVVHREDDDDDKLVVADKDYPDEAILRLTRFQEKWFKSSVVRK